MSFSMTQGPKPIARRAATGVPPRYGLMDAPSLSQLAAVADRNIPPVLRPGLLNVFAEPAPYEKSASRSVEERILDQVVDWGRGARAGYKLGSSTGYETVGDLFGLVNRFSDAMVRLTGKGTLAKDTPTQAVEDWFHDMATAIAPRSEDYPRSIQGKFLMGLAKAPVDIAKYATAARFLGPVTGFASVDALRESENGWGPATDAAIKGGLFGVAAKGFEPLGWFARTIGYGGLGAASTLSEGGTLDDVIANTAARGVLGARGIPRPQLSNLQPLQTDYDGFARAAQQAQARLESIRSLPPYVQRQLRIGINRIPGLELEYLARVSDALAGYGVRRGGRYKLPPKPKLLKERRYDYSRSKWWHLNPHEVEVKRETAPYPVSQRLADEYLKKLGIQIVNRRENEILRAARIQLGKEGWFDGTAERLGAIIQDKIRNHGRVR